MLNILNPRSAIRNPQSLPVLVAALLLLLGCATAPPQHPNRLELAGARNLRDLGGYSTIDGRQIKKGMLYRMDHPKRARERDVEAVVALGVKTVYDLRSEKELERDPPRLQAVTMLEVVHLPVDCELIVLNYTSEWSSLLRNMAKPGGLPGIIHCTYGRDRTGVSVAIILRSLGVPEETVLEDYLLSNTFWESETDRLSCFASCASCFRTPRSEVRALMEVRPEYLEAAFEAIDYKYGSFEGYLHEGLGIGDATLERLRSALLE